MSSNINHGELDGIAPKVAVIMAGGNNLLTGVAPHCCIQNNLA